ncbi:MAG: hypothetical protein J0L76_21145 [Rhodobacterales bacterium]|nr:hypothetical protein [Rhodobacterales bacterium]
MTGVGTRDQAIAAAHALWDGGAYLHRLRALVAALALPMPHARAPELALSSPA